MLRIKSFWKKALILSSGVLILGSIGLAIRPDRELRFSRIVFSTLSTEHLERHMGAVNRWPQWFYSLASAKILGPESEKPLEKGDLIQLNFDPKKGPWKRFELQAKVISHIPGKEISIELLDDSSGRLTRLFDPIQWKISLEPNPTPSMTGPEGQKFATLIRGTCSAKTKHWRARLIGSLAETILMNQIFYPNLFKLAELIRPFEVDDPRSLSPSLLSR
jgi:hypothetical protein